MVRLKDTVHFLPQRVNIRPDSHNRRAFSDFADNTGTIIKRAGSAATLSVFQSDIQLFDILSSLLRDWRAGGQNIHNDLLFMRCESVHAVSPPSKAVCFYF